MLRAISHSHHSETEQFDSLGLDSSRHLRRKLIIIVQLGSTLG